MRLPLTLACCLAPLATLAQQAAPQPIASAASIGPVASVATEGVTLHGAMSVERGRATLANNGEVTAGARTAALTLSRGGTLSVCASTTIHIARDSVAGSRPGDAGLMFSLDRGAFETDYIPGSYSDVILTPDLRLLVSPPGLARLKLRVNQQGDTCVDNSGDTAPYVVASSLMEGGAYRIRPGQRVLFVHGSLQQVVDNEKEPCGCPPDTSPTELAGKSGGPSSTPADTAFPTAVSEGLQAPPTLAGQPPVVPAGQAHAQVSATLSSSTPPGPPPAESTPAPAPAQAPRHRGLFGSIGHFFSKVFGAEK